MPFGTLVYALNMERLKSQSRKANPGLFVGFPLDRKGILVHVPALGRVMPVIHYTVDYSVTTKEHRRHIDWYGAHDWQGVLDGDAIDDVGGNGSATPPSPQPTTRGGRLHMPAR